MFLPGPEGSSPSVPVSKEVRVSCWGPSVLRGCWETGGAGEEELGLGVKSWGACSSRTERAGNWALLASPSSLPQSPHLVMGQRVQSLPVVLNLGGDVFILQNHPHPASLSPLCGGSSGSSEQPSGPSHGDPEDPCVGTHTALSRAPWTTNAGRRSLRRGADALAQRGPEFQF